MLLNTVLSVAKLVILRKEVIMVVINNNNSFTITFKGDTEDYLNQVNALARLIAIQNKDLTNEDTNYYACDLLQGMLPEPGQKIKIG